MAIVRLILGDQLNPTHRWFQQVDPTVIYVLMEVRSETDYVPHHAQKVIAIFAGMRRMAEQLRADGHRVRSFRLGDADNRQSFAANLQTVFAEVGATRFEYQEPDEWRVDQDLTGSLQAAVYLLPWSPRSTSLMPAPVFLRTFRRTPNVG
ncbi:hypothetical protein EMGBS8_19770 [Verrucomicrobiota bacterium]|nr:hypothetical protein EMGBS8_19770 [Verrucomicrobiota bacterium]